MPKKLANGLWKVDIRPYGANGPRIRKQFNSKAEAIRFEAYQTNKAINEPWNPDKVDYRKVSELIHIWHDNHGQYLAKGYIKQNTLLQFARSCNDKQGRLVTPEDIMKFRNLKLQVNKVSTVNLYISLIKGLFNQLRNSDVIDYENPVTKIKPIRHQEEERSYLSKEDMKKLLQNFKRDNTDLYHLALICLSTGSRWGEAYNLEPSDIQDNLIQFKDTKSKKIRKVKVSSELAKMMRIWIPTKSLAIGSSRNLFTTLSTNYGLKKRSGQSTHILRHSFAAHFIINGGHLMTLKEILGHEEIETTMWYAHLGPNYLDEAVSLNPINMDNKWTFEPK